MAQANPNFDTILSTTLYNMRSSLQDNIFKANPLTYWLQQGGRMKRESGGAKIVIPVLGKTNSSAASYAAYDTIGQGNSTTTEIDAAEYLWKQFAVTVAISGIEEAKNNGPEKVISLLEAKIKQAEMSAQEALNVMFFADGSGNSGKDFLGLAAIIEASNPPATPGNLGNIDRTVETWWQAKEENTAEVLSLSRMTNMYNTASVGNDHPDLLLTTQVLFEKYESLLQPQLRFTDNKTADGGFENLKFKGATIMFDLHCQAGVMYFVNSNYLWLVGHSNKWFVNTPFVKPVQQDARFAQILSYGNLVASNCNRQGKLTAKTA